jgi:hypothetical protein
MMIGELIVAGLAKAYGGGNKGLDRVAGNGWRQSAVVTATAGSLREERPLHMAQTQT